jgi:hypothetical protein
MLLQLIVNLVFTCHLIWIRLVIQLLIEATNHNSTGNLPLWLVLIILWTIEDLLLKAMRLYDNEGSISVSNYLHSSPLPYLTHISVSTIRAVESLGIFVMAGTSISDRCAIKLGNAWPMAHDIADGDSFDAFWCFRLHARRLVPSILQFRVPNGCNSIHNNPVVRYNISEVKDARHLESAALKYYSHGKGDMGQVLFLILGACKVTSAKGERGVWSRRDRDIKGQHSPISLLR